MTHEEIKQLIELAKDTGVAELEVQHGDSRVRVKLAVAGQEYVVGQVVPPAAAAPVAAAPIPAARPAEPAETNVEYVKSPIVGTFYESPSPGAAPFVKVGDAVSPGKVLCIIESMKLMNEIECEISGTVVARLVENGSAVEYGEALFAVRPN